MPKSNRKEQIIITILAIFMVILLFVFSFMFNQPKPLTRTEQFRIELLEKFEQMENRLENSSQQLEQMDLRQQEMIEQMDSFINKFSFGEFEATAYTNVQTPGVADINGEGHGITKSGLKVTEGMIAVDPEVIALGTKVYVEDYGMALAADTGGMIKGRKIDVFIADRGTALDYGRRMARVAWIGGD